MRDILAAVLVVLALLLPWNVYFGIGIAGTSGWVFAVLVVATLLSVVALTMGRNPGTDRLRLLLNIPYFVVVLAFLLFTIVQSHRYGGTGSVPPGIGPGAWLGTAGAVLAAQPVLRSDAEVPTHRSRLVSIIAVMSLVLGLAATVFNLYWRTRFVLPEIGNSGVGTANLATALTALLYAVVAVIPLVIGYRWLRSTRLEARMSTVLLGASVLVAGLIVWLLPVGRDLDAFHGIAQNTATSGVGYEGYLSWVAAAALIGTATVSALPRRDGMSAWRGAVRSCLLLIAAWCFGTAVLRIADVALSVVLDLPSPPYNGTALMAFDLLAAVLAAWLLINTARLAAGRLMTTLFAVLFAAVVSRVIVGVALVPRSQPLDPTEINAVFGNTLVQQITSTFDVVLAVLALGLLVIAILAARPVAPARDTSVPTPASAREPANKPAIVVPTKTPEARPAPAPARIVRPGRDDSDRG